MYLFHQQRPQLLSSISLLAALLIVACSSISISSDPTPTPLPPQTTLSLAGSGSVTDIIQRLSEQYTSEHHDLAFTFLKGSGSGGGVKGVVSGQLDLGLMSRPPESSEVDQGIAYLELATDKVVFATSADLTLPALTSQQLTDIFSGTITNWSDVGGPDMPINLFVRDEEDSATLVLRAALFGDITFADDAVTITSASDMADALTGSTGAIGYLKYSAIYLDQLAVNPLVIDEQDPVNSMQDYPFLSPIGVVYMPANAGKMQAFLDYLTSTEAQTLLTSSGLTPAAKK